MAIALELLRAFDRAAWLTCDPPHNGSVMLLTWTVDPEPIDAGVPEPVARVLAEALLALGTVVYGCDQDQTAARPITVRRGHTHKELFYRIAVQPEEMLPAFDSGMHDWSQNSQWLIVTQPQPSEADLTRSMQAAYGDWLLPEPWPETVRCIVQSAVDGDGAACFTMDSSLEEHFRRTLRERAISAKMKVTSDSLL